MSNNVLKTLPLLQMLQNYFVEYDYIHSIISITESLISKIGMLNSQPDFIYFCRSCFDQTRQSPDISVKDKIKIYEDISKLLTTIITFDHTTIAEIINSRTPSDLMDYYGDTIILTLNLLSFYSQVFTVVPDDMAISILNEFSSSDIYSILEDNPHYVIHTIPLVIVFIRKSPNQIINSISFPTFITYACKQIVEGSFKEKATYWSLIKELGDYPALLFENNLLSVISFYIESEDENWMDDVISFFGVLIDSLIKKNILGGLIPLVLENGIIDLLDHIDDYTDNEIIIGKVSTITSLIRPLLSEK